MTKYHSSKVFQFFAIVIISSLCLLLDTLTEIHFNKVSLPKNHPEYNAAGVEGRVFNSQGKILYHIASDTAWEYPSDERIFLKKLDIFLYDESTSVVKYQVASDDGWLNHTSKVGYLGKNVVAVVSNPEPHKVITMYGNKVAVDFAKKIFSSSEDVKVVKNASVVTAHGFTYDSNREFLTLNSKVKVVYVP